MDRRPATLLNHAALLEDTEIIATVGYNPHNTSNETQK
jgi:hypothetical protein